MSSNLVPQRREALRHERGEIRREQRRVVVAENVAEEDQTAGEAAALDTKWQEQDNLRAAPSDHDGGGDAFRVPHVALPGREPVEGLERRGGRNFLEVAPLLFDGGEIVMD